MLERGRLTDVFVRQRDGLGLHSREGRGAVFTGHARQRWNGTMEHGPLGHQQQITATYALAGHADDGTRFLLRHEIFRPDGKLSARVTSAGGWLDLNERKLIAPPPALLAAMNLLERTSDFVVLPSSTKPRAASRGIRSQRVLQSRGPADVDRTRHREVDNYLARKICRDLEIPEPDA